MSFFILLVTVLITAVALVLAAYAIAKLPFQILQTAVGSAIALFLCWGSPSLVKLYRREFGRS